MPFGLFRESDHPRGPGGKFSAKGGGKSGGSGNSGGQQKPDQGVPGSRPKVVQGRENVAKPANHGKRNDPQIAGVKKSDFEKQKLYVDPNKKGWEKRAIENTNKIAKARGAAIKRMLKHPGEYMSGKHDWLWAEGTENTRSDTNKSARNAPVSGSAKTGTSTSKTQKKPSQTKSERKTAQLNAQKELVTAKHRELGMRAAAEAQKKHPSKAKLKRLQNQQMKIGRQANAISAKQLQQKANNAVATAKKAGRKDLQARMNANTAQQKAIGARMAVELAKKHPNRLAVGSMNRKSAKLANQAKKLNRKGSKAAVKNARAKVKAAKKALGG